MPKRTPITPEDLYQVRMPTYCEVSPDGQRLLTVVSQQKEKTLKTESHLWATDLGAEDPAESPSYPYTGGDKNETRPKWSPDGSRIAFISSRSGKSELWTIPAGGGEASQLTKLEGSISDFDWHPNGKRLVVALQKTGEEEKAHAELKENNKPGADSERVRHYKRLTYKIDGAGFLPHPRAHLWLVDAGTGKGKALTEDDLYEESEPRFSPDGRTIYFVSNRQPDPDQDVLRADVWCIPTRGGEIEKVRTFAGPSNNIAISPDGQWIAFIGRPDPHVAWNQHQSRLYLVPSSGGRPVLLSGVLDRDLTNASIGDVFGNIGDPRLTWSPDSEWIYFVVSTEGDTQLWRVSRKKKQPEPVLSDPGVILDFSIDFEGRWIHYSWCDLHTPGEILSSRLPDPKVRTAKPLSKREYRTPRVATPTRPTVRSKLNSEWIGERHVSLPEEIWFEGRGNHPLQGWVLYPPGLRKNRKYPALLYIHGGPGAQYGHAFFHEFQALAAQGYVVFYSNPRGGQGYTQRHLNSIVGRWGTYDYEDLMKFTDVVLRRKRFIDRKRVGVAGGSYGGFMTNWIIGHTQRFACAVTQRCISNWMSFIGASDFGQEWRREFDFIDPWKNPMYYLKRSPLYYVDNMRTPTLIEHQEEDHRCPIDQAEQLWSALKVKGVPCEFIRYPAEPHGMSRTGRPDRRIDRIKRIVGWLDRWLK